MAGVGAVVAPGKVIFQVEVKRRPLAVSAFRAWLQLIIHLVKLTRVFRQFGLLEKELVAKDLKRTQSSAKLVNTGHNNNFDFSLIHCFSLSREDN